MSSIVNNTKLNREDYSDLLLTALVDSELIEKIKITVSKVNPDTKVVDTKETIVEVGDMIEVISLSGLDLVYSFGKVKRMSYKHNFIYLDISDDYDSAVLYIDIANIRDIEIFDGTFKLYPENNNSTEEVE